MASGEMPKYQTIAADLRRRLASPEFSPGDQLASQAALAGDYDVTIMTLRQAVAELEREGLIRTERGKGTFVSHPPAVSLGLDHLSSFAQEMAQQGMDLTTEVLAIDHHPDADDVAIARSAFGEDDTSGLVSVVRRRSIDGRPIVVQRSTMRRALWERIETADLTSTSLYDALADLAEHRVDRATEAFRAVNLSRADAAVLGVPDGTACLESTRISFSDDAAFLVDRALMLGSASEVRAERTADHLRLGYATPT